MDFGNSDCGGFLCVDDEVDQDGYVGFTSSDGVYSDTTIDLDVSNVKELIKHLQSILEEGE